MADNDILIAPGGTHPTSSGTGSSTGGSRAGTRKTGTKSKAKDPYAAAEARALKRENEAKRKASEKYIKQAETLNEQAQALRKALTVGFRHALNIRLGNVSRVLGGQDAILVEGYRKRVGSLEGAVEDNQKAEAAGTFANLGNRGRERANAVSEAMLQGAGETDTLRAQQASLRNWSANQMETNRGFYDTLRSVNSSLTDLNIDTKTARTNLATEANADREQLWNSFYAQKSEAYTALGNIRGQQAELYGLANEAVASKNTRRRLSQMENLMGGAFDSATAASSSAWRNPGIPKRLREWEGAKNFEGQQNMSLYRNAQTDIGPKRPEGATLRAWSQ